MGFWDFGIMGLWDFGISGFLGFGILGFGIWDLGFGTARVYCSKFCDLGMLVKPIIRK